MFKKEDGTGEFFPQESGAFDVEGDERDFESEFRAIWKVMKEDFPALGHILVENIQPTEEDFLQYTGGEFVPGDDEKESAMRVVLGDLGHIEGLREKRERSLRIAADMLGVPFEKMNAEMVRWFIVLHEAGHAHDFVTNYQMHPEYEGEGSALNAWEEQNDAQSQTLPIPGLDLTDLRTAINQAGGFREYLDAYPMAKEACGRQGISSEEQLLEAQELAYRQLPVEHYADTFAANFMKKYADVFHL